MVVTPAPTVHSTTAHEQNGKVSTDTIYPKIPVFHYLNEDSVLVSNKDFNNKVWIF